MQGRVGVFRKLVIAIVLVQEGHDDTDCLQRTAQVEEFVLFQVRILHADACHRFADVEEIVHLRLLYSLHESAHLTYLRHLLVDECRIVAEAELVDFLLA